MPATSAYCVDTNVLLRSCESNHPNNAVAKAAIKVLTQNGNALFLFPQNVREFWNVATRPVNRNGLGMTPDQAEIEVQKLETTFAILEDGMAVYKTWRSLVRQHKVSGVQVHDCYLAAALKTHSIPYLITFNPDDFVRFGIATVDPASINP